MDSLWIKTSESAARPPLYGDTETEVAVIGGGMAGILTALFLQEHGVHTVGREAGRTGGGTTCRTTAKLTSQHGAIYAELLERFGREKAQMYAHANQRAIENYRRVIEKYHISCDFEETDALLYSHAHEDVMRREAEAAASLGLPASFTSRLELPLRISGAVRFTRQAQFHPLKFLYPLADQLTVYERTPAERVEGHTVFTPKGRVKADKIVFACHYPFVNFPGLYFARMHQERSYVLALENAHLPQGMYYGYEAYAYSLRRWGNVTLLGGGVHRTGENPDGGHYRELREAARILFPESREIAHWSAQDCMTASGVPYIGQFSRKNPDFLIATGFRKWGMTSAMAAAEILTGLICDGAHPDAAIFDPTVLSQQRADKVAAEGAHAVKGLAHRVLHGASPLPEELPVGHGGPALVDGKQMGVYRASETEYYAVDLACPHLGCRLEWNPDEKSWDCPCHGSRFDYRGNHLNVPAQTALGSCRLPPRPDARA